MIKKSLLTLIAIVAVILIVAAFQPADFRVERKTVISAPPAAVFGHVNDFHQWINWSPWEKLDPDMKRTYSGANSGTGAEYGWSGNSTVGEGRATITGSRPNESIRIRLDFVKPMASTAISEYTFRPQGNQTEATWSMSGQKSFLVKAVCLFVSMDKMMGGDFEKGLANLKTISETVAQK